MKVKIERRVEGLALDKRSEYGYDKGDQEDYYGIYVSTENGFWVDDEESAKEAVEFYRTSENGEEEMLLDISRSLKSEMAATGQAARADIEDLWLKIHDLETLIGTLIQD